MPTSAPTPSDADIDRFLAAPVADDIGGTVRGYLCDLLAALWREEADSKYGMTGMSDWRYDLYRVAADLGLIPRWRAGHGVAWPDDGGPRDPARLAAADDLIIRAIRRATLGTAEGP